MKIAVTGATGYIGASLISAIKKQGFTPLACSRKHPQYSCEWQAYDLYQESISFPSDTACIVHLAMNLNIVTDAEQLEEINAANRLISAAQKCGAIFVYVSSQTASATATTMYGKTKWKIEQIVEANNGIIIRPGLVYGGVASGLFHQLCELVKKSPLIPFFIPSPKVQPVHVDDLCKGILLACEKENTQGIYSIATYASVPFHTFLQQLAIHRLRKPRILLPIPRFIIDLGYKILPNNAVLTRLHSLFTLPHMNTSENLHSLGLTLRPLDSGLHRSGSNRRRLLLNEGKIFLSYILNQKPDVCMVKRYVKSIEALRNNQPLGFSNLLHFFPLFLALYESNSALKNELQYKEFIWRLNAATAIGEASPLGAIRYLRLNRRNSFLISALICTKAVTQEIVIRITSSALRGFVRHLIFTKTSTYDS